MTTPGIVLLAHGSRGEKKEGDRLNEIASLLQKSIGDGHIIQPAFLQFNQPDLENAIRALWLQGLKDIIVLPYFLFEGSHYNQHIPAEINRIGLKYPGLNIKMARSLGVDQRIIDVVVDRLKENLPFSNDASLPQIPEGTNIEEESFAYISQSYPQLGKSAQGWVMKRALHATADPDIALALRFHPQAIPCGIHALRQGRPIITDVRMVAVGINRQLASSLGCRIFCAVEEAEKMSPTPKKRLTRTAAGIQSLASRVNGSVVVIGNAPTALLSLLETIDKEGYSPALIIGLPVGFISAAEAKEQLMKREIPYITLPGQRGGSPAAAACLNALLHLAIEKNGGNCHASI